MSQWKPNAELPVPVGAPAGKWRTGLVMLWPRAKFPLNRLHPGIRSRALYRHT